MKSDRKKCGGPLVGQSVSWVPEAEDASAAHFGDLDEQPWDDLKQLTPEIEMEEFNFGTYYICRGTKP